MEHKYSDADYQEMERLIPAHIQQIRSILQEEDSLEIPLECNNFLGRCLRMKDGNIDKAVNLVRSFYGASKTFHSWDANFRPSLHQCIFRYGTAVPLKHRDADGRLIMFVRPALWDPRTMDYDQVIACLWMLVQFLTAEFVDVQRNGFVTVWDLGGFSLQHAWAVKQWRLISLAKWIQNGVAGRMKAFHSVNQPRAVGLIYKAIKPFLKEKLKKRITFHDSQESLLKQVDGNYLPTLVGGTLDPEECIDKPLLQNFLNSDQYFQDIMDIGFPKT